jgi:site-specific DNA recombinase
MRSAFSTLVNIEVVLYSKASNGEDSVVRRAGRGAKAAGRNRWKRGHRVIIYLRVSDAKGREDSLLSPELQERTSREWADREGLIVVDVVTDLDKSGRDITKRQVNATIRRIEQGEADGLLVLKVDRFGRNLLDSLLNIRELQDANGFLASATEKLEDIESSMGRFSLPQMLAIAELQSDQIGEGWVRVHDYRRGAGLPHDGRARFGYIKNDVGRDGDPAGVYTPDHLTGSWLARAYESYVGGKSIHAITKELNESAIRTVRGTRWSVNSLRAVLDSGFGAGLIVDRRDSKTQVRTPSKATFRKGAHNAVISDATWQAYVRRRDEKVAPRAKSGAHKFAQLLCCDTCKRGMVANTTSRGGVRIRRFRCHHGAASQKTASNPCPAPAAIEETRLDEVVYQWLLHNASGEGAIDTAQARLQRAKKAQADVGRLDQEIERQKKRLARLTDMLLDADEDDADMRATFNERQVEIRVELRGLREQREALSTEASVATIPMADAFGALAEVWERADVSMMNHSLKAVISRIYVKPAVNNRWDDPADRVVIRGRWETEE